ncbi:MAG: 2OG-Fe(II) oxygenase family protein, partial [Novosphingobium sp.]
RARGLAIDRLFERFNQSDWLALFRHLTGDDRIACVSGSATRYLASHFLTCHRDDAQDEGRLFAFVLNVTAGWRADWGGLLQFHDPGGDIARGMVPRFNSLHLFAVPQAHSVSQVATFAPVPRLAISGWLRESGCSDRGEASRVGDPGSPA